MIGTYNVGTYYSINVKTPNIWTFGATNSITYVFNGVNRLVLNGQEIQLSSDVVEVELGGIRVSATIKIPVFKIHYNSTEIFDLMDLTNVPYNTAYLIGKYNSSVTIGSPDTTAMPFTYLYQQSDFMFSLELYTMKCEKHIVNKSSYLFDKLELLGQLTEECDILNPSILLQYDDTTPLFMFNYVFIPLYWRYYFITSIVSVRKGLWRIGLHVDVLYSYNTDIHKQYGYIVRNESNPYGVILPDERYSFFSQPSISVVSPTAHSPSLVNTSVKVNDNSSNNIMLSIFNDSLTPPPYTAVAQPTGITDLPSIVTNGKDNATAYNYTMSATSWETIAREISQHLSLGDFIIGAWTYPFDLNAVILATGSAVVTQTSVQIGTTTINTNVNFMYCDLSPYLIIADFDLPSVTSFTDIEPYTYCDMYIPYVDNLVRLSLKNYSGDRILVYYAIQFSNGDASVYVYNVTKGITIFTKQIQLGQQLPLNVSNAYELGLRRNLRALETSGRVADSIAGIILNAVAENPIGAIQSAQRGIGAITNASFQYFLDEPKAQTQIASANNGFYNRQSVLLIYTSAQPNMADLQTFETRNGYPINTWDYLSTTGYEYTGYTEMTQIHYTPSSQTWITSPEIDEIESLAKNGIIL